MFGRGRAEVVCLECEGVGDVLVEEVRVEADHLVQLQQLVDLPGGGAPGPEEDHRQRRGRGHRAEHQVVLGAGGGEAPEHAQPHLVVDVHEVPGGGVQVAVGDGQAQVPGRGGREALLGLCELLEVVLVKMMIMVMVLMIVMLTLLHTYLDGCLGRDQGRGRRGGRGGAGAGAGRGLGSLGVGGQQISEEVLVPARQQFCGGFLRGCGGGTGRGRR